MSDHLEKGEMMWQKLSQSELGGIWCMEGSIETWSWSLNVPVLSSLSDDNEVSNVIHEIMAFDINTHIIFPLGEPVAALRGENELWIAMVLRNKILLDLKPP